MSQTRLENEVDKLLDRVFTVNMLLHPDKMDEIQSSTIEIDRSAEYKADQFLEWSDRCRTLIMMYSLVRSRARIQRGRARAQREVPDRWTPRHAPRPAPLGADICHPLTHALPPPRRTRNPARAPHPPSPTPPT